MTINNDQRHHDRISAGIHRLRGITHLARRSGAMAADRARYRPQPWPYMRGAARFLYRHQSRPCPRRKIHPEDLSTISSRPIRLGTKHARTTRLSGVLGAAAWPSLPEGDKERVLAEIGETIAEVQRVPAGPLAQIEPSWDAFMRGQIEGCRARHERLGLPQKFLDGLDELLRDAAAMLIALDGPPVILTGEYIPENFLLSRDGEGWRLAGLIDFGDVMTGRGEYDLLGPSAFMTAGVPRRVRSLFGGFGYSASDITPALKRRLMALMLLHRFGDPTRQICIEGWQQKAADLHELQDLLWPA